MSHTSCPGCRLRFAPALAAQLSFCPRCGQPVQLLSSPHAAFGLRLYTPDDAPHPLPQAIAMRAPDPGWRRS
ncbi:MAG TPA: hypothetical protein VGL69_12515 [Solirubrobacteraceae bacterium]|jgi:hypothetical protein